MTSPMEERLRDALSGAGAMVTPETLRPLAVPERRRFRVDVRYAVGAVAVVLVGAVVVVGTNSGQQPEVDTAALSQESAKADVSVFLCNKASAYPACAKRPKGATSKDITAIQRALKAIPGVEVILFEDRKAAFDNFRRTADKTLASVARVEDMPESFRIKMKPDASAARLIATVRRMRGVARVIDHRCTEQVLATGEIAKPVCSS